jgi:hypothetical protein
VAHVLPAITVVPDGYLSPDTWNQLERGQRRAAQRQLGKSIAGAKRAGLGARGVLIDLIVMGTHGRGGVAKAILGSVASRVLASARCPVMTIRAQ